MLRGCSGHGAAGLGWPSAEISMWGVRYARAGATKVSQFGDGCEEAGTRFEELDARRGWERFRPFLSCSKYLCMTVIAILC